MNKSIIVSPSGNLYGSEKVLLDYINSSNLIFEVYVPKKSLLQKELSSLENINIKTFESPKSLYFKLFINLLFKRNKTVYVNEGGHIKYITYLAKLQPQNNFVVHLRMIYDSSPARIGNKLPKNVNLIAISNYVAEPLKQLNLKYTVIYDGYNFQERPIIAQNDTKKRVFGIVGRITKTKGFDSFQPLLLELEKRGELKQCAFHFYGENYLNKEDTVLLNDLADKFTKNVILKGFKSNQDIYDEVDAVVHLCQEEGLGRIFYEAIDHLKPFVGFDIAGIKEIGQISGLTELLSNPMSENWHVLMAENIVKIVNNYAFYQGKVKQQKLGMGEISIRNYAAKIDAILDGEK